MHANGDFPKKFKIHGCVYNWNDEEEDYCCKPSEDSDLYNRLYDNYWILDDEDNFNENNKSYDFEESN